MNTIQTIGRQKFIFENNNITVETMFNEGKIWLTKKQIADVYWVKKSDIKKDLNIVLLNSDLDIFDNVQKIYNQEKEKNETFYSLDVLLLLGYNSKHYKETKFLIDTNRHIKKYTNNRKHNSVKSPIIKNIFKYLNIV